MVRNDRSSHIDSLRGLAIVTVIFGHINYEPVGTQIIQIFYFFNIPIFFLISGYLWNDKPLRHIRSFLFSKFRSIYLPYMFFFLLSLLCGHLVVRFVFKEYVIPFDLSDSVTSLLLSSQWLNHVPSFNFALWFLPIFFITNVVFFFLQVFSTKKSLVILALVLALVTLPVQFFFPGRPILSVNAIPVALFFMVLGRLIKKSQIKDFNYQYFFIPIVAILIIGGLYWPGNIQKVGSLMYFPFAVAGILLLQILAKEFSSSSTLRYIGANSLYIFGLHSLVANTYTYTFVYQYMTTNYSGILIWIINALFVVTLTSWLVMSFNFVKSKTMKGGA